MIFFNKKATKANNKSILKTTQEILKAIDEQMFGKDAQEKRRKKIEDARRDLIDDYHNPVNLKHILPPEADNFRGRQQARKGHIYPENWSEQGRLLCANTVTIGLYGHNEVMLFYWFSDVAHMLARILITQGVLAAEIPIEGIEWYDFLSAARAIYKTLEHELKKLPDCAGKEFGAHCLTEMKAWIELMELNEQESSIYHLPDLIKLKGIDFNIYCNLRAGADEVTIYPTTAYLLNGTTDINMIANWTNTRWRNTVFFAECRDMRFCIDGMLMKTYKLTDIGIPLLTEKTEQAEAFYRKIEASRFGGLTVLEKIAIKSMPSGIENVTKKY